MSGDNYFSVQSVIVIRIQKGDYCRQLRGELELIEPGDFVRLYVDAERPIWNGDNSWFKAGVRWQVEGSNIARVREWRLFLGRLLEVTQ